MAINKKLLHFATKANFSTQLANSNIDSRSIVFIKDTGEIWTHDKLYSCASWGTNQTNYVPLTIGGLTYNLSRDGHTHTFASLTSKPTTLEGYGITDAIKNNGLTESYIPKYTSNGLVNSQIVEIGDRLIIGGGGDVPGWDKSVIINRANSNLSRLVIHNASNADTDSHSILIFTTKCLSDAKPYLTGRIAADRNADTTKPQGLSISGGPNLYLSSGSSGFVNISIGTVEKININATNILVKAPIVSTYDIAAPTFTGALTGNASSASRLQIARTIAGVSFDGTDNISIPFANLSSIPTTLSGYGITDGVQINSSNCVNFRYTAITEANKDVVEINVQGGLKLDGWYNFNVGAASVHGTRLTIAGLDAHDKTQLYFNGANGSIQYRKSWYANSPWTALRTIWDSGNFNPSNYLPLSGGTITGSISVSGSITNLSNSGGGIFWNPYAESVSDGSDVASISVATSGGSTVMSIKQMNDANDYINFLVNSNANGVRINDNAIYHAGNIPTWNQNTTGNAATATNISNTGTVNLASATESNAITITAPSFSADKPVKLLNFNWYADAWSIGNIRSGGTASNGLGIYLNSVEKFRFYNGVLKVGTNTVYHAGNFSVTLNGSSTTSANFYAPTKQLSAQSGTNSYLIGASSTTSLGTVYSNAGIYMNGSKLYTGDIQASGSISTSGSITASNLWGIASKNVSLTLTTNWQDTGILMNDSTLFSSGSGTYIIELHSSTPGVSSQWDMRYSGVMAVFTTQTNSTDTDEIILHSMGHARNGRHIYLRTVLQASPNYAKIQIATSASWSGAGTITIKTRRII